MTRGAPTPETVTIHVPFRVVKRGGRKEMQLPEGAAQPRRTDNSLVKALARAFRWKQLLDSGEYSTMSELAQRERISTTYLARILRLTLLAPDIVEGVLVGRYETEFLKAALQTDFPSEWEAQRAMSLAFGSDRSVYPSRRILAKVAPTWEGAYPCRACRRAMQRTPLGGSSTWQGQSLLPSKSTVDPSSWCSLSKNLSG